MRIIQVLFSGSHCVEEITARLRMSQPRVSRHLRILRECGLVETRRERRRIYYSLSEETGSPAAGILAFLEEWLAEVSPRSRPARRSASTAPERRDAPPLPSIGELEDFLL